MHNNKMFSNTYNIAKERRAAFNLIKTYAIESGGIVFGGYVRDTYLKDCMIETFFCNDPTRSEFWNREYDIETVDRLLIPNDIDISFKTVEATVLFFDKLSDHNFSIKKGVENDLYVSKDGNITHVKYEATCVIGKSLTIRGTKITIDVDVCISEKEPPFANIDMITNVLVEDSGGIRISNNVGHEFYKVFNHNSFAKKRLEYKILDMIARKETEIVRTDEIYTVKSRMIKRVASMVERGWIFKNIVWLKYEDGGESICTVCMDNYCPTSLIINNGSRFHKKCFKEYVKNTEVEIDVEKNHGIKCPLRGFLKF